MQDKDEYGNDLPGSHWVAFGITKKGAFYCDSMGIIPPTVVVEYLKEFKPVPYNIQEIQYIRSTDCGWFAVAVCDYIHRSKKKNNWIPYRFYSYVFRNEFSKK